MRKYAIVDNYGNVLKRSNSLLKLLKIVRCSIGPRYDRCLYEKYLSNPVTVVPADKIWNDGMCGRWLNELSVVDLDYDDRCAYRRFEYYYEKTKRPYSSYDIGL